MILQGLTGKGRQVYVDQSKEGNLLLVSLPQVGEHGLAKAASWCVWSSFLETQSRELYPSQYQMYRILEPGVIIQSETYVNGVASFFCYVCDCAKGTRVQHNLVVVDK
jgi:hypothetical protein